MKTAKLNHLKVLEALATNGKPGIEIYRALRRVEPPMQRAALNACNTPGHQGDVLKQAMTKAREGVERALGTIPAGFFINDDPRGHALKLDCGTVTIPDGMHRDMGGDGMLAPEFKKSDDTTPKSFRFSIFIADMGSYSGNAKTWMDFLWDVNSARQHDSLPPVTLAKVKKSGHRRSLLSAN